MNIPLIIMLAVLGALLGSFAAAQVWRLRARQLVEDKKSGETVSEKELQQLKPLLRSIKTDRSQCLHCRHSLAWYDLIPIISWLTLGGRCRYCRAKIGSMELFAEVGLAIVFAVSYILWPYPIEGVGQLLCLTIWLIACVIATILLLYDAKWSLLPFELNIGFIVLGVVYVIAVHTVGGVAIDWLSLLGAVGQLGGLYLLFSLLGWVGMGDGILGIGLGLFLGSWQLAFITLFIANFLGCLMIIPLYLRKKLHRNVRIPFGPFLIIATIISMLAGNWLIATVFSATSNVFMTLML